MYPKFIEVHMKDGETVFINVGAIELIADKGVRVVGMPTDRIYTVTETYEELEVLVKDCGCLIRKADPRLDLTHPLTLDDLKDMIGEPVWNSNLDRWELVTMVTDLFCKTCHTGQYAGEYSEDDLIKTPLYRMRQ